MPSSVLPLRSRPAEYFENPREDLVAKLPRPLGRVLDVGCGAGGVGRALRRAGASELVGIEFDAQAAELARSVFDTVIEGDVERLLQEAPGVFNTICCYDVLEHLYDPVTVLDDLRAVAAPDARLHISIPNARYFLFFRDLLVRGTFGYEVYGHRDATHLRWFTRRDIERLVVDCGWELTETTTHAMRPGRSLLTRLTGGWAREFFAVQWHVLCRAR